MDLPHEIIETKPYNEMTDFQQRRFLNFIEWLEGVERVILEQGMRATGIAPQTRLAEDYVFTVGQAEFALYSPAHMDDQLQAAPSFPRIVPENVSPPALRRRIDSCFGEETELNPEGSMELAVDLQRQGYALLEKAALMSHEVSDRKRRQAAFPTR